jgi:hypothetical protein
MSAVVRARRQPSSRHGMIYHDVRR